MIKGKEIRLIALDMDGTLFDDEKVISEKNKEAIEAAHKQGVEVILSTGRHLSTCLPFARELDLSSYLITVNGSEIWTVDEKLVDRQPLGIDLIKKLVEIHKKHKTNMWMTSTEEVWRNEFPEDIDGHQWLKFGFDITDVDLKNKIWIDLEKDKLFELTNSSPTNIEVNAVGVNKARAIEKVCLRLGITMDQVMAVGDSLNDIKMIEEVGVGVAMGNAQDTVKQAADWVTETNNASGVAQAIEKWILS